MINKIIENMNNKILILVALFTILSGWKIYEFYTQPALCERLNIDNNINHPEYYALELLVNDIRFTDMRINHKKYDKCGVKKMSTINKKDLNLKYKVDDSGYYRMDFHGLLKDLYGKKLADWFGQKNSSFWIDHRFLYQDLYSVFDTIDNIENRKKIREIIDNSDTLILRQMDNDCAKPLLESKEKQIGLYNDLIGNLNDKRPDGAILYFNANPCIGLESLYINTYGNPSINNNLINDRSGNIKEAFITFVNYNYNGLNNNILYEISKNGFEKSNLSISDILNNKKSFLFNDDINIYIKIDNDFTVYYDSITSRNESYISAFELKPY